jgi:predicted glycoside hydrolase/deacetylase ChbG (UPF0249 family)
MTISISDTGHAIRLEMVEKTPDRFYIRIYNDGINPSMFIDLTFPQFQRLMAFGEMLCHPRFLDGGVDTRHSGRLTSGPTCTTRN